MKDLVEALTIFLKYGDPYAPTHCEHDALHVAIDPALVSKEDKKLLKKLSFIPDEENDGGFCSFRFGKLLGEGAHAGVSQLRIWPKM